MPRSAESPLIAVLMPLFGHSVLVADALVAALAQSSRYPFIIIVINDGCRFAESDEKVRSILAVYPDRIRYVAQPNGGLSAARNTGIDYALKTFDTLQAIYFLDADNALRPKAIESAYTKLLAHPEASWVYPNIDMFGVRRHFDYGGPYSLLKHTRYNICEAGSLVHRRVFDAGVRFDEQMRQGYEDWDFWLSASQRGFRGVHHSNFGFLYRNRAESMLSQSKREDAQISAYLQKKHRGLLDRRNLAALEAAEAPRYALIFLDTNETWLSSGVSSAKRMLTNPAFDQLFWRNIVIPNWQYVPPVFVFITRAVYDELTRAGLMPWLLYDCERALVNMNFACVTLDRVARNRYEVKSGGSVRHCSVLAVGRDLLCSVIKDADTRWIENIQSAETEMRVANRWVTLPRGPHATTEAPGSRALAFLLRVMSWRSSPYLDSARQSWLWRDVSVPLPHLVGQIVRDAFGDEVVYPAIDPEGARHIGFIVSVGSFGGVERVAYNVARQFQAAGWRVHLFVLGAGVLEMPAQFSGVATSINFLDDAELSGWDSQSEFQGTALPAAATVIPKAANRIVAALGWLDAVVNCHSGALNAAAASLRRLGVRTVTHLHLLDHSPLGRSCGHAMIALAYEHAYDLIACNSEQLGSWMHAAGIPREKLVHVPNAPGHHWSEARPGMLAHRAAADSKRLNALFLGRLDRQKGIDRLAAVIERTQKLELPIEWRVVGAPVTDSDPVPAAVARHVEPPVFESAALAELFAWSDVLILLSDYEGVPLAVLEAQRAGAVVIATRVGALTEIIDSGRTGFLVDIQTAVEDTVALLGLLSHSTGLRAAVAAQARVIEWPQATAELIQRLTRLVDAAKQSRAA